MKKTKLYSMLVIILLGIWLIAFHGIHPQVHKSKDVKEIIITVWDFDRGDNWPNEVYRTAEAQRYERILSTQEEVDRFVKTLAVTWDGVFPLNSHESGSPYYRVKIVGNNETQKELYFDNSEWGTAGKTPKRITEYMKKIMS